mgnify:CR=1 FL=1|jgi:hypothetical protein
MIRVGISVGKVYLTSNIFENGAGQNAIFLYKILMLSESISPCFVIDGPVPESDWVRFGVNRGDIISLENFDGDVLLEVCAQLKKEPTDRLRARGVKIVKYEMGNKYVFNLEAMLVDRKYMSNRDNIIFDEIWTTPQHVNTCKSFLKYDYNCEDFYVMPHIWSSEFVDYYFNKNNISKKDIGYSSSKKKRISVFEPNINIVKTSIIPMIIIHNAYKDSNDKISEVYITNASNIGKNKKFKVLANKMIPGNNGIVSFEARYAFPHFVQNYTDIVLCHQWENGLNYLYFDALYLGYPLVHNSSFLINCGYYYPRFDADLGANALLRAINDHDSNIEEYNSKSAEKLWEHRLDNPKNIFAYEDKILKLVRK